MLCCRTLYGIIVTQLGDENDVVQCAHHYLELLFCHVQRCQHARMQALTCMHAARQVSIPGGGTTTISAFLEDTYGYKHTWYCPTSWTSCRNALPLTSVLLEFPCNLQDWQRNRHPRCLDGILCRRRNPDTVSSVSTPQTCISERCLASPSLTCRRQRRKFVNYQRR